jgi:hypothetical protein
MTDRAGDLEFLDHPVAQHLLTSMEPAQLAYTWLDGTPRTVPIWFHWDGEAVVFATPARARRWPHCVPTPRSPSPSTSTSGPTRSWALRPQRPELSTLLADLRLRRGRLGRASVDSRHLVCPAVRHTVKLQR